MAHGPQERCQGAVSVSCDGIRYGTIAYADAAGGVGQGLLLWYAGITTKDRNTTEHALDYLARLAKKSRTKIWPGPLPQFVLGRQSLKELFRETFETDNLQEITELAKSDILTRRHLIETLFVLGTQRRKRGDQDGCRRAFKECAQLEILHVVEEWYLAAAEAGLFPPGKS